ncbi:MAG: radical SAM protein [Calditrichaeota bacterium]|nr:radical SAM protein [Calditrichota bacterium]
MKISLPLVTRFLKNYVIVHHFPQRPVAPLLVAYFVTFRCNLRCEYCVKEENLDSVTYPELTTEQAIKILERIRTGIPSIAFSGGEPLLRDDIVDLVRRARALKFKPISLFTNALYLPQKEEILNEIDFLQISLDTMDDARQDKIFGVNKTGLSREIKEIIRFYAKKQREKEFSLNLNAVINTQTIADIPGVYRFAKRIGVRLTVSPQLLAGRPIPSLINNRDYQRLIDQILDWKQRDATIMDTEEFLRHIQTFKPFTCYPLLTPRIYPNGEFIAPCPLIQNVRLNLLDFNTWDEAYRQAIAQIGNNFTCHRPCFLPCYLETSTLLNHLPQTLREFSRLGRLSSDKKAEPENLNTKGAA